MVKIREDDEAKDLEVAYFQTKPRVVSKNYCSCRMLQVWNLAVSCARMWTADLRDLLDRFHILRFMFALSKRNCQPRICSLLGCLIRGSHFDGRLSLLGGIWNTPSILSALPPGTCAEGYHQHPLHAGDATWKNCDGGAVPTVLLFDDDLGTHTHPRTYIYIYSIYIYGMGEKPVFFPHLLGEGL